MKISAVPQPKEITPREGYLCAAPTFATCDESFSAPLQAISEVFDRIFALALTPSDAEAPDESLFTPLTEAQNKRPEGNTEGKPSLVAKPGEERSGMGFFIKRDEALAPGEYRIEVGSACRVTASCAEGLCRAFSVIAQISERTCDKYVKVPKCVIHDRPDSPFRGLLIDVARRWHPADYLFRYVDVCSMLGVNRLILHFTDDESYTLPCRAFPLLPTGCRHYTEEEMRALDSYAASRGVTIIPEIDMPGHSAQFSLKYPEIFGRCGIMEATDKVFGALGAIYKEASELFPHSPFIHAGGDEAVLGRWDDSDATKEYMADHGIPDFVALYGHFVGKVCKTILSLGRTPIVWEGFGKGANDLVPKETLVISWENHYQTACELSDAGFTLLNASWRPLYVVSPWQKWSPREILSWDKYSFDHWWETSKAYGRGITLPRDASVEGGMLCAWGDYLKNYESSRLACQLEFASVVPRLSAAAEKLWNDDSCYEEDEEGYESAARRLDTLFDLLRGECAFRGKL